ncbi:hypothetical protein [Streptomyces sp. NPDC088137]|uniref:hypothetical protein n=1 Tax=Streptomyces sp. NPDC088137 TaxID=3365827 RepID=UPI003823D946
MCANGIRAADDLRAAVDDLATGKRAHAMDDLPWMVAVGGSNETGLRRCVREMFHPELPDPTEQDGPWAPRS